VDPEASWVMKARVSFLKGRLSMNGLMFT
jgi:hypothetical protein